MSRDTRLLLTKFVTDTRHRDHELEDVAQIARKFLAIQSPVVDTYLTVYPFIGDDLSRLEYRASPGGKPSDWNQAHVPLAVWEHLIPAQETAAFETSVFKDFKNHLQKSPLPVGQDATRLFFMQSAKGKNLRSLIDEMYPQFTERQSEALHQHLVAYQPHEHLPQSKIVQDVASIIINMPLPSLEGLFLVADTPEVVAQQEKPVEDEMVFAPSHPVHKDSQKHLDKLASNPVLLQYKAENKQAPHFPIDKSVKQMLVALLVKDVKRQQELGVNIMGARQVKIGTLFKRLLHLLISHLIFLVMHSVTQVADDLTANPQARDFYATLTSAMPLDTVQGLCKEEFVQHMMTVHMDNYRELWPMSRELQQAIGHYRERYPEMDMKLVKL
jgi:hypothetical protein